MAGEKLVLTIMTPWQDEPARHLKHDGVRVGEIIAYRAWRVIRPSWLQSGDKRLHSVLMKDYVWHPDEPASGDVRTHGIYSCRDVIRSKQEYWYSVGGALLLFGKAKIWGEVVEHELGYRSQFAKIVSLDYGDPELLEKFRKIYRVNQPACEPSATTLSGEFDITNSGNLSPDASYTQSEGRKTGSYKISK